ncbi:hypothetical protein QMK61_08605 [Fulvimonas sp. R45]|uniref:hypothetical protein n=1 Tax=Fulvimonas sp. R45 TaxID=3045937 RepID=UPI00265F6B31|nr:hypothetical protein [Fulvimonas sp. R45]MDO1528883.1 hypothetical protein [Fulvimonas sp. R45]
MSAIPDRLPATTPLPASRGLRWCLDGLRLWRRVPLRLFLLCFAQLLAETLLQLIPWVGVTLSKLVVPVLLMGILLGLDEQARGGRMRWACLLDGLRRRPFAPVLALAASWGLGVFAVQQGVAWLAYGWPAVDAVWLGHAMAHRALMTPTFERVLLVPGVVPSILLMLAPCLCLFDGRSPWRAVCGSVRAAWRHAAPFGVFLLMNLAVFLLVLAKPWTFVLVLFLTPWSMACTYAIWRDLRRTEG